MRFRALGAVSVLGGAGWVPVPAEQQRIVLAVLIAEAGRVVSTERLVDAVWGDRPPRRAVNTVHAYVMRLRRLLSEDGHRLIATRGHGYELLIGDDDLDATVFERLVGSGRQEIGSGRVASGAARLAEALALWRGPVFADVPNIPPLRGCVTHLEQLRLAAQEDHVAAVLDLSRHATVVDELPRLVEEAPLRERRWALLMRALAGSGRRAEALEVFRRARQVLRAELGVEPGPELRELHRTIVAEDSARPPEGQARPGAFPARLDAPLDVGRGGPAPAVVIDHLTRALELHRWLASRSGAARTLVGLGEAYRALGRLDDALDALTEALALHREFGDRNREADTLRMLATVHRDAGRHAEALDLATTALALARETGNRPNEAEALTTLATVHERLGRLPEALDGYRQALGLARAIGGHHTETEALTGLASAHHRAGQHRLAAQHARSALAIAHRAHLWVLDGDARTELAVIDLDRDPVRAVELAQQARAGHRAGGNHAAPSG